MFSRRTLPSRKSNWPHRLPDRSRRSLLDLTLSNPEDVGLSIPQDVVARALTAGAKHRYTPQPLGIEVARQAVADYYGRRGVAVSPERVVLTATIAEAYLALFTVLADPEDHVLVPTPSPPVIAELARAASTTPVPVPLDTEPGGLDIDILAEAIAREPKAVALATPGHPTGACLSIVERRTVLSALQHHGTALISEEALLDYLDEPERFAQHSFARSAETLTATVSGLSTVAGQPGLKLSWLILNGPDDSVDEARERLTHWLEPFVSVATPIQHSLPEILDASDAFQASVRDRRLENIALLDETCRGTAVAASPGDGGWFAVLRLPATKSDEQWADELREEEALHTYPGGLFNASRKAQLVVSLLVPPERFLDGLGRIVAHIEKR